MSELSVGSLSGLAANSYVVDIASGSTLDLSNATDLPASALPAGSILQLVSTTKTDTFSTTSTSFTDLTGLSATITPRSTSSKIYAVVDIGTADHSTTEILGFKVTRGGTDVGVGDSAGSRKQANAGVLINAANRAQQVSFSVLDSPSSTSSLTYQVQCYTVSGTMQINRSHTDTNTASYWRASSSITLIEVAG